MLSISQRPLKPLHHPQQSMLKAASSTNLVRDIVKQDSGAPDHADASPMAHGDKDTFSSSPRLPDELWIRILDSAHLPPTALLAAQTANKQMLRVGSDNRLWRAHLPPPLSGQNALWLADALALSTKAGGTLQALWNGQLTPAETVKRHPDNRVIVFAAVKQDGRALKYAAAAIKADKDVVRAAVKQSGWALEYAAALKADKDVVRAAVKQDGGTLMYADAVLKADKDVVLAAVKQNGLTLTYADAARKADKNMVLAAVEQNGLALMYADPSLRADKDVVFAAVKQNSEALSYADPILQMDAEIRAAANATRQE